MVEGQGVYVSVVDLLERSGCNEFYGEPIGIDYSWPT